MKYFKLVHAPTWKILHYMKGILFMCTRQEKICIFNNFPLSASLLFLVRYIFLEKRWFFMKYFKLVHAPTWKIPSYMTGFLSICTRQEVFGIFNNFPLSATLMPCTVHFFRKKKIFHEIFQIGACPNLKDSFLYDRFSIHMYKARSISLSYTIFLYLRLSYALYGPFFWKRWFFMKYFKLVHAPTWKIPYYMTGFLSICTRHEAFGISNIFPLSMTPSCPVRFFLFLGKDEFLINYFKLVHAPTWKIP